MNLLFILVGAACGIALAGGIFAFITTIGVVLRLSTGTHTDRYVLLYEDMVLLGGLVGNLMFIYEISFHMSTAVLGVLGLLIGIFTGCLAASLAEVLNVFPILVKRLKLQFGIPAIIFFFGLGKACGALYQMVFTVY